jgi:hypothetical protein
VPAASLRRKWSQRLTERLEVARWPDALVQVDVSAVAARDRAAVLAGGRCLRGGCFPEAVLAVVFVAAVFAAAVFLAAVFVEAVSWQEQPSWQPSQHDSHYGDVSRSVSELSGHVEERSG